MIKIILGRLLLLMGLTMTSAHSYSLDMCKNLNCVSSFICIEALPGGDYGCRCAQQSSCKNNILSIPEHVSPSQLKSLMLSPGSRPSTRSCTCLNGGACQQTSPTPSCACKAFFSGSNCEIFSITSVNSQANQANNLCRVYSNLNMNICQNGGQCVFIADGKVACICASTHTGQFCEREVYLTCNASTPFVTCHRDYGYCSNGMCFCNPGYSGPKCDQRNICQRDDCLNNGICQPIDQPPYKYCICQQGFYGPTCNLTAPLVIARNQTTQRPTTTITNRFQVTTLSTPCNLIVNAQNSGGYNARVRVVYTLNGERVEKISSYATSGLKTNNIEIPYNAENLEINLESYGISWSTFASDRNVVPNTTCEKCYVMWGPLGGQKWDYRDC